MCNVCSLEKKNFSNNLNGEKGKFFTRRLFRAYANQIANLKLCYVHDIELFLAGEERFLKSHLLLAADLKQNPQKYLGALKDNDELI